MARPIEATVPEGAPFEHGRLYRGLARKLINEMAAGRYPEGSRLPSERDLALTHNVSRPIVREAIIAIEVLGLVEVRLGSGVYVKRSPGRNDVPGLNITAFELTEARLLFEGEAAALAATLITDEGIAEVEGLVRAIARENLNPQGTEQADRDFHLAVARATRNQAILEAVEHLWNLRSTSPDAALLHEHARLACVKPVVEQHAAVLDALKARDPERARAAMRMHLAAVLDSLLFATEEKAIEEARLAVAAKRARYTPMPR